MIDAARWLVFGASVRGPDHEREGLPCQDAWASSASGERGRAVCVCDGAGSASHADLGARIVASAVIEALQVEELAPASPQAIERALLAAFEAAHGALLVEAAARGLAPGDLACTVVAVVAWGGLLAVAHLGDGAVIARRRGSGELFVASAPDRGEYANETWFLTSSSWRERLRVGLHEGVDAFCAFSDGCQGAALVRGGAPFAPFCAPLFEFAAEVDDPGVAGGEVAGLLQGEALRRSSGDDKTLAVALLRS